MDRACSEQVEKRNVYMLLVRKPEEKKLKRQIYIYIYIYTHTHTHTHIYIYIYIYTYIGYMFRSYDHLQAEIYLLELTLLTTDPSVE
jgi:hypothetical protein